MIAGVSCLESTALGGKLVTKPTDGVPVISFRSPSAPLAPLSPLAFAVFVRSYFSAAAHSPCSELRTIRVESQIKENNDDA